MKACVSAYFAPLQRSKLTNKSVILLASQHMSHIEFTILPRVTSKKKDCRALE